MVETTTVGLRDLLDELRKVDTQLHTQEADRDTMIREARRNGASWAQIGKALGTSKQAAWERFRLIDPQATTE